VTLENGLAGTGWDGHLALLYGSEAERRTGLAAWVRRGLDLGEKVIYAEAPDVAAEDSVRVLLDEQGVDVAGAAADGGLAMLSLAEIYPPGGQVTVIERALAEGFTRVRLTAEAGAALGVLTESDYAVFEREMDELCRTRPVSALCQYERQATTELCLRKVVATHLAGIRDPGLRTGPAEDGIAFDGELDISNVDMFAAAVDAVVTANADAAPGLVRLDLGEVCFVDVAACRALVTSTRRFRRGGGRVLVIAPHPMVERVLQLLDVDRLPGFEIIGSDA